MTEADVTTASESEACTPSLNRGVGPSVGACSFVAELRRSPRVKKLRDVRRSLQFGAPQIPRQNEHILNDCKYPCRAYFNY